MRCPAVGPSVWRRGDFLGDPAWIHVFSEIELSRVRQTMEKVDPRSSELKELQADGDGLPALEAKMDCVRNDLLNGPGVSMLRGLDVDEYDAYTLSVLYMRVVAHLGLIIPQNAEGDLLRCVTDLSDEVTYDQDPNRARGHRGRAGMSPHSDSSDIVGLLCVRQAKHGGANSVCSSMAIHNEILRVHPEFLDSLYEGFYFDLTGKSKTTESITAQRIPVFHRGSLGLCCTFNKDRIEVGMRKAGIPLNDIQQAAVNYLDELAVREEFTIPLRLLPGDILFLNNLSTLHAREAYEDWPDRAQKRLMLRIWLNVPSN